MEDLQLQLAKREEELTQAMMKVDDEAAGKAQAQKAIREVESQLTEVRRGVVDGCGGQSGCGFLEVGMFL